ncbi:hypothetical protein E2C01_082542 [Portunus trituberculatus]|uniref:Uncharacterized protein n=1 Tax=Portunus trituberculatus TaxID=210409 RepID=A0A5B7IQ79_PORTR|nr:hypothetical protein [Portunus trituberculatus]
MERKRGEISVRGHCFGAIGERESSGQGSVGKVLRLTPLLLPLEVIIEAPSPLPHRPDVEP